MAESLPIAKVVAAVFLSLALYNFLELNVYILNSFKRRRGLYFWSFTVSTYGILFNSIGYILMHLAAIKQKNVYATLILIGWCMMITGQSVVLYSRLHIVVHNLRWLRYVLIMIITNAIWLHIPIIVLVYGANSDNPTEYLKVYNIYERIQLSVFCAQELIISGLYLYETTKLLRLERTIGHVGTRTLLHHLVSVNILVIILDFSILGLEFANLFEIQTSWKPLVYSIKLKVEFSILSRLVKLTRNARSGHTGNSYTDAGQSGGVALGTMRAKSNVQKSMMGTVTDERDNWEIKVSGGHNNLETMPSQVLKTTEFTVQSHSRPVSRGSFAESGKKILAHTQSQELHDIEQISASSSVSSGPHSPRYHERPQWQ